MSNVTTVPAKATWNITENPTVTIPAKEKAKATLARRELPPGVALAYEARYDLFNYKFKGFMCAHCERWWDTGHAADCPVRKHLAKNRRYKMDQLNKQPR